MTCGVTQNTGNRIQAHEFVKTFSPPLHGCEKEGLSCFPSQGHGVTGHFGAGRMRAVAPHCIEGFITS